MASQGKGLYSLGRRIVELERLLQQSDPLLLAGKPVMDSLHPYCDNRAFLGASARMDFRYVGRRDVDR